MAFWVPIFVTGTSANFYLRALCKSMLWLIDWYELYRKEWILPAKNVFSESLQGGGLKFGEFCSFWKNWQHNKTISKFGFDMIHGHIDSRVFANCGENKWKESDLMHESETMRGIPQYLKKIKIWIFSDKTATTNKQMNNISSYRDFTAESQIFRRLNIWQQFLKVFGRFVGATYILHTTKFINGSTIQPKKLCYTVLRMWNITTKSHRDRDRRADDRPTKLRREASNISLNTPVYVTFFFIHCDRRGFEMFQ